MATCTESIANMGSFNGLTEIIPNTVTSFNVTATSNNLFKLLCPSIQTIKFNFNAKAPTSFVLTAFAWNGSTATSIGSVNITTPNSVAQIDFQAGDYIICIRPSGFTNEFGTFVAQFTGYQREERFQFSMHSGENMTIDMSTPRPPRECDEALFFEIIDGELPPGLKMDHLGTITGILPNLDCLPDRWSPAVNWYYDENDDTTWPWGREWRFEVRVTIDGQDEDIKDEEWFCVRIYNNWTFDQERFLAELPFEHVTEIRVVTSPEPLPIECQPCKNFDTEPMFVPKKIEDPTCLPCQQDNQETVVELIPIPLDVCQIPLEDLVMWYVENESIDSGNTQIENFKEDLRNSSAFKHLRARAGYAEPDEVTEQEKKRQFVVMQNYQNFLQFATIKLNEGESEEYKSIVRDWQVIENQVLPTSTHGYMGESCEVELR